MIYGILHAISLLWLVVLTVHHYQVFYDFEKHQNERTK